jgi:peptidyl-prolyl cis-trans isomerase SurA
MKQILLFFLAALFLGTPTVAQTENPVLLTIGDREISLKEFERLLLKNFTLTEDISVEDYLEMFINFQLKVLDAKGSKLHLEPSFVEEYKIYRQRLARPYLTHPETEQKFMKEAYERMQYDIHASHILVKIENENQPGDTLFAWEKALRLREQILAGDPFEAVARRASDDPSAKVNSGNIGFFTAFQMIYPFEKAAYSMEPGEISMPVRSRFGYHIIRVNERRNSPGEVKLRHILLRIPQGADEKTIADQKNKIQQLHDRIRNGEDFGKLAAEYSQDLTSKARNGEMDWFGTGRMIPEFEQQVFNRKEIGSISEPFQTQYGWHIIKLLDKKKIAPFEDIKEEIRDMLYSARDERGWIIQQNFMQDLKIRHHFREEENNLDPFFNRPDSWSYFNEAKKEDQHFDDSPLFFINETVVSQEEFAEYVKRNLDISETTDKQEFIENQYKNFVAYKLIEQEDKSLESRFPEFRYLTREYYDGLLLFEITEQKVWSKAISDSAGLLNFYEKNKNDYLRPEKLDATFFTGIDHKLVKDLHRFVSRATRRKYSEHTLVNNITQRFGTDNYSLERSEFEKGKNTIAEKIVWKKGTSNLYRDREKSFFFLVHDISKPKPYQFEEIRGLLIADYQDQLEQLWIEELRRKYPVSIDKKVLERLKEKYNQ